LKTCTPFINQSAPRLPVRAVTLSEDWADFGKYYALYFETAKTRSEIQINNASYEVFLNMSDPEVLDVALRADKYSLDTFGPDDPEGMDTYASLLYRVGRVEEALVWEEKAVRLAEGRDKEIVEHLEKMKDAKPTWPVK